MDHHSSLASEPRDETRRQDNGLSDTVGPRRTTSDAVGHGRTMSDERRDEHTLTSLEVAKLFEQSGVPRSQRSVERYCRDGKLDCFHDPDEDRYYATSGSVETLIGLLKEIQDRHRIVAPDVPGSRTTAAKEDANPASDGASGSAAAKLRALESEVFDLKITNRAKDYFIDELKADRLRLAEDFKNLVIEFGNANRQIGELQSQVRQLEAPKDTARSAPAIREDSERAEDRQPA